MERQTGGKRMIHYDLLRIIAAFSVVMLHASAQFWYTLPVTDTRWLVANSYNALFRFGVPIFVMLSGALFLSPSRELDVKRLYKHNILRLLVLYLIWSCVYGSVDCYFAGFSVIPKNIVFQKLIYGRYHLWYLLMIIGIYMLLPILKTWTAAAEKKNIEYFLILFLICQIGKETVNALFPFSSVLYTTALFAPYMVSGYLGYFILGYYISRYGIDRKYQKWIYLAAIPSAVCNIYLSFRLSAWKGQPVANLEDSFGIFTFVISVALFLLFTEKSSHLSFGAGAQKLIREISLNTLGIYVMHILLIERLEAFGVHSMMLPNIIGIPLLALISFVFCGFVSAILRRIPFIGKFLC